MMKLIISGTPEEIAALVVAIQERQASTLEIQVDGQALSKACQSATRDHHEELPEEEPLVALESVPTVALFEELQSRKETISFEAGPYMQYDIKPKYGIPYSPMVLEPLYVIAMRQEDF